MSVAGVFHRITATLDRASIHYMLTGSFASAYYGAPRTTQDIDVVVAATPDQLRTFVQLLARDEYYVDLDAALEAHKRQTMFNVVDLVTGWKIDFIIRKSRAFSEEEFRRRAQFNLQGVPLFVASRGRSHLEARMGKAGTIRKTDRGRCRDIENAVELAGSHLPGEMDPRVGACDGMERCSECSGCLRMRGKT